MKGFFNLSGFGIFFLVRSVDFLDYYVLLLLDKGECLDCGLVFRLFFDDDFFF